MPYTIHVCNGTSSSLLESVLVRNTENKKKIKKDTVVGKICNFKPGAHGPHSWRWQRDLTSLRGLLMRLRCLMIWYPSISIPFTSELIPETYCCWWHLSPNYATSVKPHCLGFISGEKAGLSFRGQHTISCHHRAAGKFCWRCPLLAQSWSVYLILLRGGAWNSVSHRMKWPIEVFQPVTSDSFRIMMGYKLRLKHFWIKRKGEKCRSLSPPGQQKLMNRNQQPFLWGRQTTVNTNKFVKEALVKRLRVVFVCLLVFWRYFEYRS